MSRSSKPAARRVKLRAITSAWAVTVDATADVRNARSLASAQADLAVTALAVADLVVVRAEQAVRLETAHGRSAAMVRRRRSMASSTRQKAIGLASFAGNGRKLRALGLFRNFQL